MVNKTKLENRILPYKMLLESLYQTREIIERILPESVIPSFTLALNKVIKILSANFEKAKEGSPIVGYHFSFPAEYLYCFDCVPICIEVVPYFLNTLLLHGIEKYYDLALNWGHPYHTCSSQRGAMGMSLDNLFEFDAIITATAPCDSTCASYQFFKYKEKFPLIIADMPFLYDEKSYYYYGDQIKLALNKLGKTIGQEPDFEKLKKAIEIENSVLELKLELFELIKAIPSPIENLFNAASVGTNLLIPGTQENLSFYQEILEMAKSRYKNEEHYGAEERIRTIWPYMVTYFDISLLEWLDRELGLRVLFDIFNYNFSDPINTSSDLDTMFYGMAKKAMNMPMVKQSGELYYSFIDDCVRMAKEFSVDCFIYTSAISCKQFGSVPMILREALRDEVGIPMLIIEFDQGDARVTSLESFKEKIKSFVNTLL